MLVILDSTFLLHFLKLCEYPSFLCTDFNNIKNMTLRFLDTFLLCKSPPSFPLFQFCFFSIITGSFSLRVPQFRNFPLNYVRKLIK